MQPSVIKPHATRVMVIVFTMDAKETHRSSTISCICPSRKYQSDAILTVLQRWVDRGARKLKIRAYSNNNLMKIMVFLTKETSRDIILTSE